MRQTHRRTIVFTVLSCTLVLLGAACGDSTAPSIDSEFTADVTNDVGAAQADEVDESVTALELESTAAASLAARASFSIAPGLRPRLAACATVDNTTDSDGDGTPDEATFTFALPACHFTNFRGGTLDVTGAVVLSDPTPSSADATAQLALNDFRRQYTNADQTRSFTTTRNGTRALIASASGATITNTVTAVRSVTGRADATITHNTLLTFTPDEGQTLQEGEPLPSGSFEVSGMLTWSRNGRSRTFTATTVTPLRWDATCTTDRKISEGEVHWTLSNGSYIKTVWSGCGIDPIRTFVPAS